MKFDAQRVGFVGEMKFRPRFVGSILRGRNEQRIEDSYFVNKIKLVYLFSQLQIRMIIIN